MTLELLRISRNKLGTDNSDEGAKISCEEMMTRYSHTYLVTHDGTSNQSNMRGENNRE